ncbi:MAG: adenylyl-sulfate kinase [Burkholderiales bacterium]|nr:adenylyl-sulfate kinase [Burkholderiales bacterium]
MVIWIIGLSGAGKTTLGQALVARWRQTDKGVVLVDGDVVRRMFEDDGSDEAYTVAGRRRNAARMVELCRWLDQQGIDVVCCILCPFADVRAANRSRFSRYFEIYLNAPLEVLAARDAKDLYAPALRGERRNVVGVDIAFEPPQADLMLDTARHAPDPDARITSILTRLGVQ